MTAPSLVRRAGVDYMHPDLGGGFGPGFRVAYGYDFVGSGSTASGTAFPDSDPIDICNGALRGGSPRW